MLPQEQATARLTLAELERLMGMRLPPKAMTPSYWSTHGAAGLQWACEGFTAQIDPTEPAIIFTRVQDPGEPEPVVPARGYAALCALLAGLPADQPGIRLSFAELERLLGVRLPRTAHLRQFWSGSPTARRHWLAAGFTGQLERPAHVAFTRLGDGRDAS